MMVMRFRSVGWVAAVATAALGCYLVTQRVAGERQALEKVEHNILLSHREIRRLSTEIETRGRLGQLERWNQEVLALSAPRPGQFLRGELQLASFTRPPTPMVNPAAAPPESAIHTVAYEPAKKDAAPAARAADETPMLRQANFVTTDAPMTAAPRKVSMESSDFAADLAAIAKNEVATRRR
jgi:hypothetical protein